MEIDCSLVWWSMGLCETHQYVCIVHSSHEEFYYQATWPFIVAVAFLQLSNLVIFVFPPPPHPTPMYALWAFTAIGQPTGIFLFSAPSYH